MKLSACPALLPATLLIASLPVLAQQAVLSHPGITTRTAVPHARAGSNVASTAQHATAQGALPIRRVSLYKNGVGFFEHIGTVHGNEAVSIDFTTAQLNDVLQSLTAVDLGGGRIAGAGYNSTTPLDQQLKSLPLSISADPTAADFYTAIRGARVEVTGAGATITGRILNIELRDTASPKKDDAESSPVTQRHFLTIVSDAGAVRTLELTSNTSVRLLDPALHNDVNRYLEILAANHQDGLRHLTLTDNGSAAARELRVSYISEVPVWKCTYRLLFDDNASPSNNASAGNAAKTATIQGWAVIDNTVGSDWNNVELSLIAGSPQSFLQPISQPYYTRRPEVGLPEEAQLVPQTHESGDAKAAEATATLAAASPASVGRSPAGISDGNGSGYGNGAIGGVASSFRAGNTVASQSVAVDSRHYSRASIPKPAPVAYEDSASASVTPNTTTTSFDDYFEYKLTEPVTIRKNESALVPILQTKVDVDPVTLWSPNEAQPLRALWIRNTSALTLDRGSFSILENGNFSGQGLLDPIHPGERRLLSYAADQAVRVTQDASETNNGMTRRVQQITIAHGVLTEKTAEVVKVAYLIHNAAPTTRTVVVEQPRRNGWTLESDPKPEETTGSLYRFRVTATPGETARLSIGQRHVLSTSYRLADTNEEQLTLLLRQDGNPQNVTAALQPIFTTKRRLSELDSQIGARNTEMNSITNDQRRVRENLAALKGSAEERDLVRRYTGELNRQEDRLAVLRTEIIGLQQQQQAARDTLATQLEGLQLDATLN